MTREEHIGVVKAVDVTTLIATASALLGWLPHIAAGLAVIWWLLRIYYEIRLGQRKLRRK